MRKKGRICLIALLLLAALAAPALASDTLMNLYIEKETLSEEQAAQRDIRSKNGELLVTRQSVYPWDEAGSRWAVFVELQNTTDDMIVIDETWMYTCRADRETTATWHFPQMDGAFYRTANRVAPGERTILYAGSEPVYEPVRDKSGAYAGEQIAAEGLEPIAGAIRGAKLLRVRMTTRNSQSPSASASLTQISVPVEGEARVADGKLYLTVRNATDEAISYAALGAVLSDARGCIVDVMEEKQVTLAPGESVTLQKDVPPYATADMMTGAALEPFGYVAAKDLAKP